MSVDMAEGRSGRILRQLAREAAMLESKHCARSARERVRRMAGILIDEGVAETKEEAEQTARQIIEEIV